MTTIVALHEPSFGTIIGCDTQITDQTVKYLNGAVTKWIRFGDWAVGSAGPLKTINLLKRNARDLFGDLRHAEDFPDRLETMLDEAGYETSEENPGGPTDWGCVDLMLASPEGVWEIDSSMSIIEVPSERLGACGSGAMFALGVGHATDGHEPIQRVRLALSAAINYDLFSGGAPWIDVLAEPNAPQKIRDFVTSTLAKQ